MVGDCYFASCVLAYAAEAMAMVEDKAIPTFTIYVK